MKGSTYSFTGNNVPLSFKYNSHENLAIGVTASTSSPINHTDILLSLCVAAHIKIGSGDADVSDFVLPSGLWSLVIDKGSTISVLKLTGSDSGQASIIIPGE